MMIRATLACVSRVASRALEQSIFQEKKKSIIQSLLKVLILARSVLFLTQIYIYHIIMR